MLSSNIMLINHGRLLSILLILRLDFLLQALKDTKVDGVVSQNVKFCEPYAIDAPFIVDSLKKHNYKVINLERDFTSNPDQQMHNRLDAFRETL